MKKLISMILAVCMTFCFASAAHQDDSEAMPLYLHLTNLSALVTISSSGYAEARATATTDPGYNVDVTLELQRLDDRWTTIYTQTGSGSGFIGTIVSIDRFVVHGTYQAKVTAVVTDANGKYVEPAITTSQVVRY